MVPRHAFMKAKGQHGQQNLDGPWLPAGTQRVLPRAGARHHDSCIDMQRDVAPLRNKSLVLWTETELLHWPGEENWGGNFFKLTLAFDLPNLSSRVVQFSKTFVVRLDAFYMYVGASFSEGFQHLQRFLHVNLPSMVNQWRKRMVKTHRYWFTWRKIAWKS